MLLFRHRRDKVFYCTAQLGVADNKVDRRGVSFGHHGPLPLMNEYLQIAEGVGYAFVQHIVGIAFGKSFGFFQMLFVFGFTVKNIPLAENAGKLKHRGMRNELLRSEYRYGILYDFRFENGHNPLFLSSDILFDFFCLFGICSVP